MKKPREQSTPMDLLIRDLAWSGREEGGGDEDGLILHRGGPRSSRRNHPTSKERAIKFDLIPRSSCTLHLFFLGNYSTSSDIWFEAMFLYPIMIWFHDEVGCSVCLLAQYILNYNFPYKSEKINSRISYMVVITCALTTCIVFQY